MDTIAAAAKSMLLERRLALAKLAQSTTLGAQDVRVRQLEEVEAALARIEAGTYGQCEICNGAIGRTRLRAIPEVRRCLGCSAQRA